MASTPRATKPSGARVDFRLLVAIAALASCVAGLPNDFVYDDAALIHDDARIRDLGNWRAILFGTYWPAPFPEDLYRPISTLFLSLQYIVGGGSALIFRIVSSALYATACVAFFGLARRVLHGAVAFAVALLFAVHPIHVEAVAQGVNQSELIVGLLCCLCVSRYIDTRRTGTPGKRDWTFILVCYVVAVLTKETGFVLPALLLAAEVLGLDGASWTSRARRLWAGYAMLGVVAGALVLLRQSVLPEGALSAHPSETMAGLDFAERMRVMTQIVPHWLRLFVWPLRLAVDYQPADPMRFGALNVLGILLVVVLATVLVFGRRRWPVLCFGLAWCAIALLPVSNIIATGVVLAERTLFLASVGFLLAAGAAVQNVPDRLRAPRWKTAALVACGVLLVLGIVRSTSRHLVWNTAHIKIVPRGQPAKP